MADQKNHSFISSSKIKRFFLQFLLFSAPVFIVLFFVEYTLTTLDFSEPVKQNYINNNRDNIEILFLGSSQVQRAINPRYLTRTAINLANKSQILYDDFQLLKHFGPKLPNLKLVVLEVSYDKLERDETYASHLLDPINLKFYGVNTFNRPLKIRDYSLFFADSDYFSVVIQDQFTKPSSKRFNEYGFDENRYDGIFQDNDYKKNRINNDEIIIDNVRDEKNFHKNLKILHQMINYCFENNLKVMIYHPPTHNIYQNLQDPELVLKWESILEELKIQYPAVRFYIDEKNPEFKIEDFYNANHLNPDGAEKATRQLNDFILKTFF